MPCASATISTRDRTVRNINYRTVRFFIILTIFSSVTFSDVVRGLRAQIRYVKVKLPKITAKHRTVRNKMPCGTVFVILTVPAAGKARHITLQERSTVRYGTVWYGAVMFAKVRLRYVGTELYCSRRFAYGTQHYGTELKKKQTRGSRMHGKAHYRTVRYNKDLQYATIRYGTIRYGTLRYCGAERNGTVWYRYGAVMFAKVRLRYVGTVLYRTVREGSSTVRNSTVRD